MPEGTSRRKEDEYPQDELKKDAQAEKSRAEAKAREKDKREAERKGRQKENEAQVKNNEDAASQAQKTPKKQEEEEERVVVFKDMRVASELSNAVRNKQDIVASEDELQSLRNILTVVGNDLKDVEKMSVGQMLVAVQEVAQDERIVVADAEEEDWLNEKGQPERVAEEKEVQQLIETARSKDEVKLDAEKVEKYVKVSTEKVSKPRAKAAVQQAEIDPDSRALKLEGEGGTTYVVATSKRLYNLEHRQVEAVFRSQGVDVKVPSAERWNRASGWVRQKWLHKHDIVNTTELPEVDDEGRFIYKDRGHGMTFVVAKDGTKKGLIYGQRGRDIDFDALNGLVARAGIDVDIEKPEGWEDMSFDRKKDLFREKEIFLPLPASGGAGGGVIYYDTQDLGVEMVAGPPGTPPRRQLNHQEATTLLMRRLVDLDTDELTQPAANVDRQEVFERLRDVSGEYYDILRNTRGIPYERYKGTVIEVSLIELKALESLERNMGTAAFATSGYEAERQALYRELADIGSTEEILHRIIYIKTEPVPGPPTPAQHDELQALIGAVEFQVGTAENLAAAKGEGFRLVNNVIKGLEKQEVLTQKIPNQRDVLDDTISETRRKDLRALLKEMGGHFKEVERQIGVKAKNSLYIPLNEKIDELEKLASMGSTNKDEIDEQLYIFALSLPSPRGTEGLLEWRAAISTEGVERNILRQAEVGVPRAWSESERNAENNFRYIESSDLSQEEVRAALGNVVAISEALSRIKGTERIDALRMKEKIDKQKLAVEGKYYQRKLTWNGDGNPEKFIQIFEGDQWNDETRGVFQSRFDRDHEGNEYKGTDNFGNEVKFNMADLSTTTWYRQLYRDHEDFNLIEPLTALNISAQIVRGDATCNQIEGMLRRRLLDSEITRLNELRQIFKNEVTPEVSLIPNRPPGPPSDAEIDKYWADPKNAEGIISAWHKRTTLVGAHGKDDSVANVALAQQKKDVWKGRIHQDLVDRLRNEFHISNETIEEWEEAGLLDQAVNVGYWEGYMDSAFSEFGLVRIFDRRKVFYRLDNAKIMGIPPAGGGPAGYENMDNVVHYQVYSSVYGEESNIYNQRRIDFGPEWILDELRGKTGKNVDRDLDTNTVLWEKMLGKRRGMLHNNRMSVKYTSDKFRESKDFAPKLLTAKAKEYGYSTFEDFKKLLKDTMNNLDNVRTLDINDDEFDESWARGAALAELFEDGFLSFEGINWSEVYNNNDTNVSKFNMGDWTGDRKSTWDFYGTEGLQRYLKTPNTKIFFDVMSEKFFYSKRENRLKSWYKIVLPAHFEIGDHWKEWYSSNYNMTSAEKEEMIEEAVSINRLEKEAESAFKAQNLGILPVRRAFQFYETWRIIAEETITKRSFNLFLNFLLEMFKGMFGQSMAQLEGK
ncbi:MAG: hypothetical protein NUV69_03405 [Candidatus Curtissbacteria bacterium]|nr:hypothetical protein [Candidatus Curtissbacteria bacterium]